MDERSTKFAAYQHNKELIEAIKDFKEHVQKYDLDMMNKFINNNNK